MNQQTFSVEEKNFFSITKKVFQLKNFFESPYNEIDAANRYNTALKKAEALKLQPFLLYIIMYYFLLNLRPSSIFEVVLITSGNCLRRDSSMGAIAAISGFCLTFSTIVLIRSGF